MRQLEYDLKIIFNFISGVPNFKKNTALKYDIIFQFSKVAITFNFQPTAPEELLTVIRCKCKNSTRNQCGTNIFSCKRNGLSCVTVCGERRGVCCYNSVTVEEEKVEKNETEMDERNLFHTLLIQTKSKSFVIQVQAFLIAMATMLH